MIVIPFSLKIIWTKWIGFRLWWSTTLIGLWSVCDISTRRRTLRMENCALVILIWMQRSQSRRNWPSRELRIQLRSKSIKLSELTQLSSWEMREQNQWSLLSSRYKTQNPTLLVPFTKLPRISILLILFSQALTRTALTKKTKKTRSQMTWKSKLGKNLWHTLLRLQSNSNLSWLMSEL